MKTLTKTQLHDFEDTHDELRTHRMSRFVEKFYKAFKGQQRRAVANICFRIIAKLEGGTFLSATMRKLMLRDYKISIGCHSYGEAFTPGAFAPSVSIGKYTSIAKGVRVFTQNHPIDHRSTHPYFYECKFNVVSKDTLEPGHTTIGHDVWIGQNAILLPGCKKVGNGAIIGAGAVVTKDVPDYAVIGGNPAKLIKYRFVDSKIKQLLDEQWWHKSKTEIAILSAKDIEKYATPNYTTKK